MIDPSTLDLVAPNKRSYKERIEEYYKLSQPIEVFGVLRFDGPNPTAKPMPDYYLAKIHNKTDITPANIRFMELYRDRGSATWNPFDENLTVRVCEDLEQVHWLPIMYTVPASNKDAKSVLTKLN